MATTTQTQTYYSINGVRRSKNYYRARRVVIALYAICLTYLLASGDIWPLLNKLLSWVIYPGIGK